MTVELRIPPANPVGEKPPLNTAFEINTFLQMSDPVIPVSNDTEYRLL